MLGIAPIITAATRHRVSADVFMLIFILCGLWATTKLTVRFFPPFETNTIVTTVVMSGSTTSEIEESIVVPLENGLRNVPDYKKIYSYSRESSGTVILEFPDHINLDSALDDVKAEVDKVNFPSEAESPTTTLAEWKIQVSRLTVVGAVGSELHDLVRRLENELNALGLGKVEVEGLPDNEIEVLIDQRKLVELNLSLDQVARAIQNQNSDASVGGFEGIGNERKIRADSKSADLNELSLLPISSSSERGVIRLRDIARLQRIQNPDSVSLLYNNEPAAVLVVYAPDNGNLIDVAGELNEWVDKKRSVLPPNIRLVSHDEEWRNVQARLSLLTNNGLTGLLLVLAVLFTFLSFRVAIWVAACIPVATLGTLFFFYHFGGTINMISMFALIMAIGIIVDDSIVVGENAVYRFNRGDPPMRAVTSAARKMFTPVFASSFTTISAFLPLFLITGPIGSIIFDIPLIICCILIAAMIECFFILPGHLYRAFAKRTAVRASWLRQKLDGGFNAFRDNIFRPFVSFAVNHATATVVACVVILFLSINLLRLGFVNYRFFPGAEGNNLNASISFGAGTPKETVERYVQYMYEVMDETDQAMWPEQKLVNHASAYLGTAGEQNGPSTRGEHVASIRVELIDVDQRDVTVVEFAKAWRDNLEVIPGIETLDVRAQGGGPPGRDIEIRLTAQDISEIKPVAEIVKTALADIPGVTSISDDTPFGKEEIIFTLTPLGRSLNMSIENVAAQLRNAIKGITAQKFQEGVDEVDLVVKMDSFEQNAIDTLYLQLPSGQFAPLRDIVNWRTEQGFEVILHQEGLPAIVVNGDLDPNAATTVNAVLSELEDSTLIELYRQRGVSYSFEGKTADEQQTAQDMMTGMVLAVILIFIILTWVFNSWSMPVVVMLTMPMGVIGTILGHWVMGLTMSILSFFGMFTLMGILVNNSIVLVDCFKDLGIDNRDRETYDAGIVEASCLRFRAVLLTSLTTIGGLLPLMFEKSLQAKFLLPMAVSICFGLAFATILILVFTPACMSLHGAAQRGLSKKITLPNIFSRPRQRSVSS